MEKQNYKNNRNLQIICPGCQGDGWRFELVECGRAASDCCGGCMIEATCKVCEGTKEIEPFNEKTEDIIRMIKALEYRKEKYKEILKTYLVPEDLEAEYSIGKIKNDLKRNEKLKDELIDELIDRYEEKNSDI